MSRVVTGEAQLASPAGPPGARGSSSPPRAPKLLGGKPPEQPSTSTPSQASTCPPTPSSHATEELEQPCVHSPSSQRLSTSLQLAREELREHRRPWRWRLASQARASRQDVVHHDPCRRIPQPTMYQKPRRPQDDVSIAKTSPAAVKLVVKFVAVVTSPSPSTASTCSPASGEHFP